MVAGKVKLGNVGGKSGHVFFNKFLGGAFTPSLERSASAPMVKREVTGEDNEVEGMSFVLCKHRAYPMLHALFGGETVPLVKEGVVNVRR